MSRHSARVTRLAQLICAFALLAASHARADMVAACRDQAVIAERAAGIPEGLLLAIGKRESGRFDLQTGATLPWPWAVNRDGESHIFETQAEAVAYVAMAQREGSQSIDVGCFQINLKYHPGAFASLDEAFDPTANTAYAARFLRELYDRGGSWEAAVADYHSATSWLGEPYRDAVLALWHGFSPPTGAVAFPSVNPTRIVMGIRIYEPDVSRATVKRPVVWTGRSVPSPSIQGMTIPFVSPRPTKGLPRVLTADALVMAR